MPKPQPPAETWLNEKQALERLQIAPSSLYRLAAERRIRFKKEKPRGQTRAVRVYAASDVEHLSAPAQAQILPPVSRALVRRPRLVEAFPSGAARLIASADKPALRLAEAAQWSGLPESLLLRLCQSGALRALKAGAWYISRRALERWIESGFSQNSHSRITRKNEKA